MKKSIALLTFTFLVFSCKFEKKIQINYNKKDCTKIIKDAVFLDTLFRKYDTCNKYKGTYFSKFYLDNKKIMEGYGERFAKQGTWRFFDKTEDTILKAKFENSELIGFQKFKNLDTITWQIFDFPDKGFRISKPKKWIIREIEEGHYYLDDKNGFEKANFSFTIYSYLLEDIEGTIAETYYLTIKQKKKSEKIENLNYKKLDIDTFQEAYEIFNLEKTENKTKVVNELIYVYYDRVFIIQFVIDKNAEYDFFVIKDIMKNSFKVYNPKKEN